MGNNRVIPRKMVERVSDDQFKEDLEKYRQSAIELGATDARIIGTDMVTIQNRVVAKCFYPKCPNYGTSAHCPPHTMGVEQVRKVVSEYRYAIFLWIKVKSEIIAGPDGGPTVLPWLLKIHEIVSKIEAQAFFDGYKLALAFAGGPCKLVFCREVACSALIPGQLCRFPLRSRPAMEAVGIDVMALAVKVGLDIYPIGASVSPSDVPHGFRFGIVLID